MNTTGEAQPMRRAAVDPRWVGIAILMVVWVTTVAVSDPYVATGIGTAHDAHDYWLAFRAADPYGAASAGQWGLPGVYVYSPAFLQLASPLLALPWQAFVAVWAAIALSALAWLARPSALVPMLLIALPEIWGGNIHLLLAVAIVLAFRYPAAWAFVLLTKVTPGVGLLWFALRREWRSLALALGATVVVALASFVVAPNLWSEWFAALFANANNDRIVLGLIPVPLFLRLPVAVALIVWAAPRNQRWAVPVACMLALPAWWVGGLAMLLAVPTLIDWKIPGRTPPRLERLARLAGFEPAT